MVLENFDDIFPQLPEPRLSALAKTTEIIKSEEVGNVELSKVDGTLFGGKFRAKNVGAEDLPSGVFVHLGEDDDGFPFFRPGGGDPPVCEAGDCPDS